jgi:hypothetical protein
MRLEPGGWARGWLDFAAFVPCSELLKPLRAGQQTIITKEIKKPIRTPKLIRANKDWKINRLLSQGTQWQNPVNRKAHPAQ